MKLKGTPTSPRETREARETRQMPIGDPAIAPVLGDAAPAPPVVVDAPATTAVSPPVVDTYEQHEPPQGKVQRAVDKLLDKVAPIRTHERVLGEVKGSLFGLEVGVTFSQLDLVKKDTHGREIVQVVNQDGSSNIELLLGRKHLTHGQRIELQGPALNTSVTPGELPVGARFIGVGLTSDLTSAMDHDAVSYTAEVKITERTVLELAALGGPGAASIAAQALQDVAGQTAASVIGDVVLGAVPVLSAAIAAASARRAWHVLHDTTAGKEMKAFAVLHALGDATRVFFPLAGTIANAALVGVAALAGWLHVRHAKHAAPVGPPPAAFPLPDDAKKPP